MHATPTPEGNVHGMQDRSGALDVVSSVAAKQIALRNVTSDARRKPETHGFRATLPGATAVARRSTFADGFAQAIRREPVSLDAHSSARKEAEMPPDGPPRFLGFCHICEVRLDSGIPCEACQQDQACEFDDFDDFSPQDAFGQG